MKTEVIKGIATPVGDGSFTIELWREKDAPTVDKPPAPAPAPEPVPVVVTAPLVDCPACDDGTSAPGVACGFCKGTNTVPEDKAATFTPPVATPLVTAPEAQGEVPVEQQSTVTT